MRPSGETVHQLRVKFVELTFRKVTRLEPNPEVPPPYSLLNLMQGVSAKHLVQRHIKAKVIEERVLRTHQHFDDSENDTTH